MKSPKIAHVFLEYAPHLLKTLSLIVKKGFPEGIIYLRTWIPDEEGKAFQRQNSIWINRLPIGMYGGELPSCLWYKHKWFKGYLFVLISFLFTELNCVSWWRILRGPKCWVLHGYSFSLPTLLILKLIGKEVILVHWGTPIASKKLKSRQLVGRKFGLYKKIYVLMQPEVRYFCEFVKTNKIDVLPYPTLGLEYDGRCGYTGVEIRKNVLVGNSAWCIGNYPSVLDKLMPGDWSSIICMLNYGGGSLALRKDFIRKYVSRFSDSFVPWENVVPLERYFQYVNESPFYICPSFVQSGLGLIYTSILQGKAIFLRGDNLLWMKHLGISVVDIDQINNWDYENLTKFIPCQAEAEDRKNRLKSYFANFTVEKWAAKLIEAFGV